MLKQKAERRGQGASREEIIGYRCLEKEGNVLNDTDHLNELNDFNDHNDTNHLNDPNLKRHNQWEL